MESKGRVLVAMSGGIDSTVTALLLQEEGYEIVGITMKTWDYATSGSSSKETGCCSLDSINDARQVAVDMGFHHYIVDIRDDFEKYVITNFVDEYMAGRTPNPCVLCNTHIKWEALLEKADAMNCEFIATGHYAMIGEKDGRYFVKKAKDPKKDQSYVLWGLSQESLKRSIFPLGEFTKDEVRKMAFDRGLVDLSKKGESYEICFVPDDDYRGFLKNKIPDLEANLKGGWFLDQEGNKLGQHKGYPFYTIGQRKGLGIALGYPAYVTKIDKETNTVVLGHVEDLRKNGMKVYKTNFQKFTNFESLEVVTMVRYHDPGTLSRIEVNDDGTIDVDFLANARGIAPGQSAVFFDGDDVVGGGIIYSGK